ncbi:MAG TPA: hypothetical protein PLC83_13950, partial [Anaerolineaceae bacterium]|nr:hypothetical protein [Anaerolineaceae bacterium]
ASPAGSVRYQPADELLDTAPTHNTTTVNAPNRANGEDAVAILFLFDRSNSAKDLKDQDELHRFFISLLDSCPGSKTKNIFISIGLSNQYDKQEDTGYWKLLPFLKLPEEGNVDLTLLNQLEYPLGKDGPPTGALDAAQKYLNDYEQENYKFNYKILVFITDNNNNVPIDQRLIDSINGTNVNYEKINETYIVISKDGKEYQNEWNKVVENKAVDLIQETSDHYQDTINQIFAPDKKIIEYLGLEKCVTRFTSNEPNEFPATGNEAIENPGDTHELKEFPTLRSSFFEIPGDTLGLKLYGITPTPNAVFNLKLESEIPQTYQMISDTYGRFESPYIPISPTPNCDPHKWNLSGPFAYYWYEDTKPGFVFTDLEEKDGIRMNNESLEITFGMKSGIDSEVITDQLIMEYGHCYTFQATTNIPNAQAIEIEKPLNEALEIIKKDGFIELPTGSLGNNSLCAINSNNCETTINLSYTDSSKQILDDIDLSIIQYYQPSIIKNEYAVDNGVLNIDLDFAEKLSGVETNVYMFRSIEKACYVKTPKIMELTNFNSLFYGYHLCEGENERDCRDNYEAAGYKGKKNDPPRPPYWNFENNTINATTNSVKIFLDDYFVNNCSLNKLLIYWNSPGVSWKSVYCEKLPDSTIWQCKMLSTGEGGELIPIQFN